MPEVYDAHELKRIDRLIDNLLDDFKKHVLSQTDLSIVLLKGHLLVEYYMDNLIVLHDDKVRLEKLSFADKIDKIKDHLSENLYYSIRKFNSVRNSLAHRLNFSVSSSDIDVIGYPLGKEYVVKKFGLQNSEKELLIWLISIMSRRIFVKIITKVVSEEKQKGKPKKNQ